MRLFSNVIYISAFFLILLAPFSARASEFFETLYDVPVMEGMREVPDMAMSFDKPNGRIAEAGALIDGLSEAKIVEFYVIGLYQMGWVRIEAGTAPYKFTREGEELSIYIDKSDTSPIIRFLLQPL